MNVSEEQLQTLVDAMEKAQAALKYLRIAHLRRMVYATLHIEERALRNARRFADAQRLYSVRERAIVGRMDRFRDACRAEITRLTQPR